MIINYVKNIKQFSISIKFGLNGRIYCFGDVSERYKEFKENEGFLRNDGYYEDNPIVMFTPALYGYINPVWTCLTFCWLFITIHLCKKNN